MSAIKISNLEDVLVLNVNMYEIENSIDEGRPHFMTDENTFYLLRDAFTNFRKYTPAAGEVLLETTTGRVLVKKV